MFQTVQKSEENIIVLNYQFEDRQNQKISFIEEEQNDELLDYDNVCKKILQNLKFITSGKKNIKLVLRNFWGKERNIQIPIYNSKNWSTLIHDMIQRDIFQIEIQVIRIGQLRQRKQRRKQNPVEFDSDGSIQSAEDCKISEAIIKNTPSTQSYKGNQVVRCHFCHLTSRDQRGNRQAGPFYGPFQGKHYAHLLCLLWMSYVYLDESLKLCGVKKAIQQTKTWKCSICQQKGGSFYCHATSCKKIAHYRCALRGWYFDWVNFTVYCPKEDILPMQICEGNNSYSTLTMTGKKQFEKECIQRGMKEEEIEEEVELEKLKYE